MHKKDIENVNYLTNLLQGKKKQFLHKYNIQVNTWNLSPILFYFQIYPLKTNKYIIYCNWKKIYEIVINKKHNNPKNLFLILQWDRAITRIRKKIQNK